MNLHNLVTMVRRPLGIIRRRAILAMAYLYDFRIYSRWSFDSFASHGTVRANLEAKTTATYHNIEKGLSLPDPRPGFGGTNLRLLIDLIVEQRRQFGPTRVVNIALSVLDQYVAFNAYHGADFPYRAEIEALLVESRQPDGGGLLDLSRAEVQRAVAGVDIAFFNSRHSTRCFSPEPIIDNDLIYAADVARKAPAVCNRQFNRVIVFRDKEKIRELLALQGGARGFEDQPTALAVIVADSRRYWGVGERNQCWIDGGLFAMSFILGLHARSLGTCCLNWSKSPEEDKRMLEHLNLENWNRILMFLAIGHLREEFRVAASPRQDVNEVLVLAENQTQRTL